MNEDRSSRALARIEQALTRIEAAASRPAPVSHEAELSELRTRHRHLVNAVESSLQQLDLLLETPQG